MKKINDVLRDEREKPLTEEQRRLVEENMNLVYAAMALYLPSYEWLLKKMSREDIIQIMFMGLINAARKYDKTKNRTFSTYAYAAMHNTLCFQYQYTFRKAGKEDSESAFCNVAIFSGDSFVRATQIDNPDNVVPRSETIENLAAYIEENTNLNEKGKSILREYLIKVANGDKPSEIARDLNVSLDDIKSLKGCISRMAKVREKKVREIIG